MCCVHGQKLFQLMFKNFWSKSCMDDAELFLCATDKDLIFQQTFYVSGLNTLLTLIVSSLAATCMYTLFR